MLVVTRLREQHEVVIGPRNSRNNRLGRRLLALRKQKDWTLAHVADQYGVDKAALSRIERGDRSPSVATLYKLRDAYSVDDETFLTWLDMLYERDSRGDAA